MIETHRCDDKEQLVAYLYDDIDAAARRRVDDHLRVCPTCAAEAASLGDVRRVLSEWHAPESEARIAIDLADQPKLNGSARLLTPAARALPEPAVETARPAQRWVPPALPAWAQAAAAVLVVAAGLAIANVQVRYDDSGLMVTTGWMAPPSSAPERAAGPTVATTPAPAASEEWRPALATLERELRGEIQAARAAQAVEAGLPSARDTRGPSMERVSALIAESERRQQRELALRLTQVVRDMDLQRRADNRRNVQAIGQFEGMAGAEMLRQRQALDYIMRVSSQPPPQ